MDSLPIIKIFKDFLPKFIPLMKKYLQGKNASFIDRTDPPMIFLNYKYQLYL